MKAMHPNMSETEIQGVHEYVYKNMALNMKDTLLLWAVEIMAVFSTILKTTKLR